MATSEKVPRPYFRQCRKCRKKMRAAILVDGIFQGRPLTRACVRWECDHCGNVVDNQALGNTAKTGGGS